MEMNSHWNHIGVSHMKLTSFFHYATFNLRIKLMKKCKHHMQLTLARADKYIIQIEIII